MINADCSHVSFQILMIKEHYKGQQKLTQKRKYTSLTKQNKCELDDLYSYLYHCGKTC